jgi:acyl-CoA thioester hydrolase
MNQLAGTESRIRVRYAETDRMGVAYHAHYLVWCEVGRTDYIRRLGTSYAAIEEQGILLAVAEAEIRYAASARYDDEVRILTNLERAQSRAITFAYELFRGEPPDAVRLATARTRLVALDAEGRPRALPAPLLERFREILAATAS